MPGSGGAWLLTPLAEADLEEIWLYTAENWSPDQADRYHNSIVAALEALADGRRSGRPVEIREDISGTRSAPMWCSTASPIPVLSSCASCTSAWTWGGISERPS